MTRSTESQQKRLWNIHTSSACFSYSSNGLDTRSLRVCSKSPFPKHPDTFGFFPSVAAGEKYVGYPRTSSLTSDHRRRKPFDSPSAPMRAQDYKLITEFDNV